MAITASSLVRRRQAPLRARYTRDPRDAVMAACHDASMRMVADLLGIPLLHLAVEVTATLDMRGTLALDPAVPVGFQRMTCTTRATVPAGTDQRLLDRLRAHAERSCVNLDTLRRGVPVTTRTRLDTRPD